MEFSEFDDIYKSMIAIVFGALTLGQNSSFMSNYAAAIQAGERVLGLLNKEPLIDAFNTGIKRFSYKFDWTEISNLTWLLIGGVEPQSCHGHLKVKGVNFAYPTRPKNPVMSDFSIEIKPGETVALVGESGQERVSIGIFNF